ncbi:MAG TPA: hypothetical protein VD814_03065, partial [Nocardioides sp.]|nr:hypothetical protein [Nocardioides sp.]
MTNPRAFLAAVTTCLAVTVALLAPPATAEEVEGAAARGDRTVTIRGHGYGHGRGLSQYGAQKAALEGRSHRRILGFYYPNTRLGRAGGSIKVLLAGDTGNDLVVRDRSRLRVRSLGSGRSWPLAVRAAKQWRITPTADRSGSVIAYKDRRWQRWRTVAGGAELSARGRP